MPWCSWDNVTATYTVSLVVLGLGFGVGGFPRLKLKYEKPQHARLLTLELVYELSEVVNYKLPRH